MKNLVLVVFIAAAATAAVVNNELNDVVEVPDEADVVEVLDKADEQDLTEVTDRRNLAIGTINGLLVYNREHRANGISNVILQENIPVNLPGYQQITAVRVTRIGISQYATPSVVSGGVGQNRITIRITSARGLGYHYRVQINARYVLE